ncbi:MAG: hypothetical protein L3K07_06340, partial [Thermoplasmata archaeon]|nr:hypothetical protein [Thermoplasmata archaeon]
HRHPVRQNLKRSALPFVERRDAHSGLAVLLPGASLALRRLANAAPERKDVQSPRSTPFGLYRGDLGGGARLGDHRIRASNAIELAEDLLAQRAGDTLGLPIHLGMRVES